MALTLPTSLSPSKVAAFTTCALSFRYANIDKLYEAPSLPATKGTFVHLCLEKLHVRDPQERSENDLLDIVFAAAQAQYGSSEDFLDLDLSPEDERRFWTDAAAMLRRYLAIEDPEGVDAVGVELMLQMDLDGLLLRGIIDRLEFNQSGEFVVTDYKTGRAPSERQEMTRLGGVHFYSLLCEELFGQRPAEVRLMYLGSQPQLIIARPTEQSTRALKRKLSAIWNAIGRSCEREDFRPQPSVACSWCSFKAYCPQFGGSIETPVAELVIRPRDASNRAA